MQKIHIDVLIASTLSSTTKCYIKSKQPVGNPPSHETVSGDYTYTLKFTGKIYNSSASLQFPAHTQFQISFKFTRLTNLTFSLPNEKCIKLNLIISFTTLSILKNLKFYLHSIEPYEHALGLRLEVP